MTENEAIERLKLSCDSCGSDECRLCDEALEIAIQALEEIQQYRAIGTVEGYENAIKAYTETYILMKEYKSKLQDYEAIGTIEEFKALKEKNEPKKVCIPPCNSCDEKLCDCECEHFANTYRDNYRCPTCDTNQVYMGEYEIKTDFCPNCGQKLDWEGCE